MTATNPSDMTTEGSMEGFLKFLDKEARKVALGMSGLRERLLADLQKSSPPEFKPPHQVIRRQSANSFSETSPLQNGKTGPLGFSPFYYYPFLFASAFPGIPLNTLRDLALANRVLLEAVLILDRHIDESRPWSPEGFYLVDAYCQEALRTLIPLFPADHPFWDETEKCFIEYAQAVQQEQILHRLKLSAYDEAQFYTVSSGKVALIKTNVTAMCLLTRNKDLLTPLVESQNRFLVGFQAFDDLKDWKEDLCHHNFTHLLTNLLVKGGFRDQVMAGSVPSVQDAGHILYYQGLAEAQLRKAETYFQEALGFVQDIQVPMWKAVVEGFRKNCRVMRLDLSEIRRREKTRTRICGKPLSSPEPEPEPTSLEAMESSVFRAVNYLRKNQLEPGGFPLVVSSCDYMGMAAVLSASPAVTILILRALAPLTTLHPVLSTLSQKASPWLTSSFNKILPCPLPTTVEQAFHPTIMDRDEILEISRSFEFTSPHLSNGLFWANLLYEASKKQLSLTPLVAFARQSIEQASYLPWSLGISSPGRENPSQVPGTWRSSLLLLVLCQALDTCLPVESIQNYLLGRFRSSGTWGHATNCAQSLLCLMATGYQGPELVPAIEKLLQSQEQDGSWAPNAIYEEDNNHYGSRELTTAWSLQALILFSMGSSPVSVPGRTTRPPRLEKPPAIIVHTGLPREVERAAGKVVVLFERVLPGAASTELYLGHWPEMPSHFILPRHPCPLTAVNLAHPARPPFPSIKARPLRVETVLALTTAGRYSLRGPLKDRLERIFVTGLGLHLCAQLWPEQAPWEQAGVNALNWRWCQHNEAFLWDELKRFLEHPVSGHPSFRWLLPDQEQPDSGYIPEGAPLYLGQALFEDSPARNDPCPPFIDLLRSDHRSIIQAFRIKVGLGKGKHLF